VTRAHCSLRCCGACSSRHNCACSGACDRGGGRLWISRRRTGRRGASLVGDHLSFEDTTGEDAEGHLRRREDQTGDDIAGHRIVTPPQSDIP